MQPQTDDGVCLAGVPSEFNEFLPKDSEEYKRWKASQEAGVSGQLEGLALGDGGDGAAPPPPPKPVEVIKELPGGKKKRQTKPEEASKLFGKKFASGASITKNAEGKEQIDCQGDFLDQAVELILKQFKAVSKADIYMIESKKKVAGSGPAAWRWVPYFSGDD
eukprot:scaffold7.g3446.t1